MGTKMFRYGTLAMIATTLLSWSVDAAPAMGVAQTPSISGHSWVALALITGFVGVIVMIVFGALHIERRDARLGRRRDDGYLFPFPGQGDDDDDGGHHHGGGHGHGHF